MKMPEGIMTTGKGACFGTNARLCLASTSRTVFATENRYTAKYKQRASTQNSTTQEVSAPKAPPKGIDVVAGALGRAASQTAVHPIDTVKVRLQAKIKSLKAPRPASSSARMEKQSLKTNIANGAKDFTSLYKGAGGAAAGAGLAIGTYFAFYNAAKHLIRESAPDMAPGAAAFIAGAAGAVGSSFVKVPAAVCIRSVQAGVYPNVLTAGRQICQKAGPRGLYTGFVPTLIEDVPDTAVKFAIYETLGSIYCSVTGKQRNEAAVYEDLFMGGLAGSVAAAVTTPVDVVKTRMMVSASTRPSVVAAVKMVAAEKNMSAWFSGVVPRAASSGLNSALFFCFFECLRSVIVRSTMQEQKKPQVVQVSDTDERVEHQPTTLEA